MPNPRLLVRTYLLQDATLVSLLGGNNIYGSKLPEKYDPGVHPAVVLCAEGGTSHPEAPITIDRVKVQVWAGINQAVLARQVYEEIHNWLHSATSINLSPNGFIISSLEAVRGQDLTDPDSGWDTVVSFFQITARN